jgi:probable addiction module antidote protein
VTGKKLTPTAAAFAARYRDNPREIAKYLNDALSTGDPVLATKAIGDMVRAQGVARFSQKVGLRRDGLYRSFSGETSPAFATVLSVMLALDVQIVVKPSTSS